MMHTQNPTEFLGVLYLLVEANFGHLSVPMLSISKETSLAPSTFLRHILGWRNSAQFCFPQRLHCDCGTPCASESESKHQKQGAACLFNRRLNMHSFFSLLPSCHSVYQSIHVRWMFFIFSFILSTPPTHSLFPWPLIYLLLPSWTSKTPVPFSSVLARMATQRSCGPPNTAEMPSWSSSL